MDSEALSGAAKHTERASFMGAFPARGERAPYPGSLDAGQKFRILRYLFMRCKQFIIVSLAGVVLAASLAGCGGTAAPASSAAASSEVASSVVASSAVAETALPDGVYTADFETDSSMFHTSEACNGKGTLTVENGVMTFHVSLASKKIVNLYPGLAADAEANKTAWLIPTVDTVTYADGTTEEVYGYDIPVEALDTDFQLALLGTKGNGTTISSACATLNLRPSRPPRPPQTAHTPLP